MCGIIAVVSNEISEALVRKGTKAISHRGPDGDDVYVRDGIGFGHTHLLIMDEKTGGQPLVSSDSKLMVVANGEFYGYENIREDLLTKGYTFSTKSDSEILLYLYKEYGLEMMQYLRGEFAFVLYDFENKRLIAGRDRFGIKPLHYTQTKDGLYFSSEAKGLFAMGVKAKLNLIATSHATTMQYILPGETLFENVSLLLPGHILIYENEEITIQKYWDVDFPKASLKVQISEDDVISGVHKTLLESVQIRLNSQQKYCCQLSGGVDSALIAAMISSIDGTAPECFTVTIPGDPSDEHFKARQIANHIGAKLTTVPLTPETILKYLKPAIIQSEGVCINSHIVGKYLLHKKINEKGYKIVYTGEGADEVFKGYEHLVEDGSKTKSIQSVVHGVHFSDGKELSTNKISEKLGYVPCFLKGKASIGYKLQKLLLVQNDDHLWDDLLKNNFLLSSLEEREIIDISTQLWIKLSLSGYILKTLGDATELAFSVEGRVPYLDHVLFEQVKLIPSSMTIKNQNSKYILRKIAEQYLPKEVAQRKKQPFMVPPQNILFAPSVLDYLKSIINSTAFDELGLFDRKRVLLLLESIPNLSTNEQTSYEPVVMIIISLVVLHEHYMQK